MEQEPDSSSHTIHYTQLSSDENLGQIFKNSQIFSHEIQKKAEQQQKLQQIMRKSCKSPSSPNQSQLHKGYNSDNIPELQNRQSLKSHPYKHKQIINRKERRKSKNRTRTYIELLQGRVNELQGQLERIRKLYKANIQCFNRLKGADSLTDFFRYRQQIFEKLEGLNDHQKQSDDSKVKELLQNLRARQGVYGEDRIKRVNYHFKQMIELMLPQIHKYVIRTAIEETDLFDSEYSQHGIHKNEEQIEQWRKSILEEINLSSESKQKYYALKPDILRSANEFKKMIQQLYSVKCSLTKKAREIEKISDSVHHIIDPWKLSKVLCYIDKYKYEKNTCIEHTFREVFEKIKSQTYTYDPDQNLFLNSKFNI